jgi:hypothetical protein
MTIDSYEINGLTVQTGDLICTTNGNDSLVSGQFWFLVGMLIPGDVDHIAVYIGPEGRCVEAGAMGYVTEFNVMDNNWDANKMVDHRGPLIDTFYGVAYPLARRQIVTKEESDMRESVARYCMKHAREETPYNLDFQNSQTQDAFYCSQLAYKAYLHNGVDLNTGKGVLKIPGTESIIFPQEIWSGCKHKKAGK